MYQNTLTYAYFVTLSKKKKKLQIWFGQLCYSWLYLAAERVNVLRLFITKHLQINAKHRTWALGLLWAKGMNPRRKTAARDHHGSRQFPIKNKGVFP